MKRNLYARIQDYGVCVAAEVEHNRNVIIVGVHQVDDTGYGAIVAVKVHNKRGWQMHKYPCAKGPDAHATVIVD